MTPKKKPSITPSAPRRLYQILIGLAAVVVIGLVVYQCYNQALFGFGSNVIVKDSGDNISDYSAVFLTNSQIYFGKIHHGNPNAPLDLEDVFYLQINPQVQSSQTTTTANQNKIVLVKLGDDLLGSNSRMQIERKQILFTESLKNDSQVVKAIADYKSKK